MKEQVNHPSHYCQHPAGIECIAVIRHYACDIANAIKCLWNAGLKTEMGKGDAEKEIEDLRKALWYIDDYTENFRSMAMRTADQEHVAYNVKKVTGYSISQITRGYEENVGRAIKSLLCVGITSTPIVMSVCHWPEFTRSATIAIQKRIAQILPAEDREAVAMDATDTDTW